MRPASYDFDVANVSLDAIINGGDSASAGPITLNGTALTAGEWVSADGMAHQISILDLGADDQSGATFTIVGTDADRRPQTSAAITGPGISATVESAKYFLTVTSVTVGGVPVATATVDVGFVGEAASQTIPLDWRQQNAPVVMINVTGIANWTLQFTNDDIQNCFKPTGIRGALDPAFQRTDQEALTWFDDVNIAASTADEISAISTWPIHAVRLIFNSYTDTAELQMHITQSRNSSY